MSSLMYNIHCTAANGGCIALWLKFLHMVEFKLQREATKMTFSFAVFRIRPINCTAELFLASESCFTDLDRSSDEKNRKREMQKVANSLLGCLNCLCQQMSLQLCLRITVAATVLPHPDQYGK